MASAWSAGVNGTSVLPQVAQTYPTRLPRWGWLVLVAVVALVPFSLVQQPLPTVGGVIVVAALIWLLKLERALVLFIALAPFENYLTQYISSFAIKGAGSLLFAAWLIRRSRDRPHRARQSAHWIVLGFLVLATAATAVHPNGTDGQQTLQRYLSFAAFFVVALETMQKRPWLVRAMQSYVLACSIASAAGLATYFAGQSARATGPITDPNDFAFFLVTAVPLAAGLFAVSRCRAWLLCAGLLVFGTLATASRGGVVALGVVALWSLLSGAVRLRYAFLCAAGLAAALMGVVVMRPSVVQETLHQKQYVAAHSTEDRLLRWSAALAMIGDHPMLGVGPAGFAQDYPEYLRAGYLHGYDADAVPRAVAHEMYLEVGSELGLPAMLLFIVLIVNAVAATGRARRRTRRGSPTAIYGSAIQGGLLAAISGALFLTEQYFLPIWLLMAMAFALAASRGRTPRERWVDLQTSKARALDGRPLVAPAHPSVVSRLIEHPESRQAS
jgi:putative inorganic carbon (HCO3(-)) transporter